jgi:hypothetical protein
MTWRARRLTLRGAAARNDGAAARVSNDRVAAAVR